ncbi:MAG: hypothetical protein Kow0025_23630 [Thermodesulfovibrionales bacterium]
MAVLRVEHRCPQCGAPVTLEETDRILACRYCRVRLYISTSGPPRYSLPAQAPAGAELVMVPYLRLRGTHFAIHSSGHPLEVRSRVLDSNFLAAPLSFVPGTLGVRPQGVKLRFATAEAGARFLPLSRPVEDAASEAQRFSAWAESELSGGRPLHAAFIGETASVIYLPLYLTRGAVYDAALKRPIAKNTLQRAAELGASEPPGGYCLDFLPALCPACGWDLGGDRNSLVLHCENCGSAWRASRDGLREMGFEAVPASDGEDARLPFWRVKARIEGPGEVMACLPASLRKAWDEGGAAFWLPAFRAAPRIYMRIAAQATTLQPAARGPRGALKGGFFPASLGEADVTGALKVLLASVAQAKGRLLPLLPSARVEPGEAALVYVPVRQRGRELINGRMGLCIPANALRRASAGMSRAAV